MENYGNFTTAMLGYSKRTPLEKDVTNYLEADHPEIAAMLAAEDVRQHTTIELIASENFPSDAVKAAAACSNVAKYSEGYPNKRYYGGCQYIDELEVYCQNKWKEVFRTDYSVNVQPHSGSNANLGAYMTLLDIGDTVLSMDLNNGGHLTHGSPVNFSGKLYNFEFYGTDENGFIDMENVRDKAKECHPKLIVAGASAYSRKIDFRAFRDIADEVGAYLMVDMAHIAGLVAAGLHRSPFGYADIITTTTHKTLRGIRGGLIFCKPEFEKKMNSAVFPGIQGGPLQNMIAAKAVTADEACTSEYNNYIRNVVLNSEKMCETFIKLGYDIVTGGTDNHLFLINFSKTHPNLSGKDVQDKLDKFGITVNKNCVPNEKRSPTYASGIRIGTPAMTTRGYTGEDFVKVAKQIDAIIKDIA